MAKMYLSFPRIVFITYTIVRNMHKLSKHKYRVNKIL